MRDVVLFGIWNRKQETAVFFCVAANVEVVVVPLMANKKRFKKTHIKVNLQYVTFFKFKCLKRLYFCYLFVNCLLA